MIRSDQGGCWPTRWHHSQAGGKLELPPIVAGDLVAYLQGDTGSRSRYAVVRPKDLLDCRHPSRNGLTKRIAPNRADPSSRMHPCPEAKRKELKEAMQELGALP